MPTLVKDPPPAGFEELLERRRELGQDLLDEVWEGVYHVNPAPRSTPRGDRPAARGAAGRAGPRGWARADDEHLQPGRAEDYRVPDGGLQRERPGARDVYLATAALVVEIVSPGDQTWEKLDFYAAHRVDELLIVDPEERRVHWLGLTGAGYRPRERSGLIELGPDELVGLIDWPA